MKTMVVLLVSHREHRYSSSFSKEIISRSTDEADKAGGVVYRTAESFASWLDSWV